MSKYYVIAFIKICGEQKLQKIWVDLEYVKHLVKENHLVYRPDTYQVANIINDAVMWVDVPSTDMPERSK